MNVVLLWYTEEDCDGSDSVLDGVFVDEERANSRINEMTESGAYTNVTEYHLEVHHVSGSLK